MPKFSRKSKTILNSCHPDLQKLMNEVIKHFDITILEGHRSKERQDALCSSGKSQVKFPGSKHNAYPSLAVDIMPYSKIIDWNDRDRFHYLGGFVLATAISMGISIRWGGDWDMDTEVKDNRFDDLVHFELF